MAAMAAILDALRAWFSKGTFLWSIGIYHVKMKSDSYSHFPLNERKPKIKMAAILAIHDAQRCWITYHAISHTWWLSMIKRNLLCAADFLESLRTDGRTHTRTDARTDGQVQNSIPPPTRWRGYKYKIRFPSGDCIIVLYYHIFISQTL